jgi:hypothetical protein
MRAESDTRDPAQEAAAMPTRVAPPPLGAPRTSALLITLALAWACGAAPKSAAGPVALETVEPAALPSSGGRLLLHGQFFATAHVDFGNAADTYVDTRFEVDVGDVRLETATYIDPHTLEVWLPPRFPAGQHAVRVTGPTGASTTLAEALQVTPCQGAACAPAGGGAGNTTGLSEGVTTGAGATTTGDGGSSTAGQGGNPANPESAAGLTGSGTTAGDSSRGPPTGGNGNGGGHGNGGGGNGNGNANGGGHGNGGGGNGNGNGRH